MISRTHQWLMGLCVAAEFVLGAAFYPRLPDPCPIHWNLSGQVDDHGPRWVMAFLFPAISAVIALMLIVLPRLGPFRANFERFSITYGRICVSILAAFAAMELVLLLAASGHPLNVGNALAVVLGLMIALLGNWFGKLRRNLYVGIRTPWTIANDTVWERTHRMGGRLFVGVGLASAGVGLASAPSWLCFVVLMGGLLGVTAWSIAYSLIWYRRLGQVDDLAPPNESSHPA